MMDIACTGCNRSYPQDGLPFLCPHCGGLFDFQNPFPYNPSQVDLNQPGIWRYRHTFGLPPDFEPLSLGEGNTPLIWAEIYGRKVAFKCEYQNPSGSFKDRGSAVLTAWLQSRGIIAAVEDSSGNAGASFAAYATRGGIKARIFVPESAGGPKLRQIEAYGADLVPVPGSRGNASAEARKAAGEGQIYASHAYLPFNLPGYATTSYEIFEQLGKQMPGAVILPAGQGGMLLGMSRGFRSLLLAIGSKKGKPVIIGVQARSCAPLWAKFSDDHPPGELIADNPTVAEGVRVSNPVRADAVLLAVSTSNGMIHAVAEDEISLCRSALALLGFYVEPTSAIVLSALKKTIRNLPDPVVVILTGSGLKYAQN
jgi:threonine synthase